MKKIDWKRVVPHIVVLGVLLLFSIIYLYPGFSNTLETHDITMYKGMSKEIEDFRNETGDEALWTGSAFGGMPADQISIQKNSNLMKYAYKVLTLGLPRPIDMMWLLCLGFYILLMCLKVDPWIALIGAIGFGLSSNFLISLQAGHMTKIRAIAFMPAVLGCFIYTFRSNKIVGGVFFSFLFAMQWWANHPQISYYTMIVLGIVGIYFASEYIFEKRYRDFLKRSVIIVTASVLAMMTSLPGLWGTYEYSKHTIRGENFLTIKSPMDLYKDSTAEKKDGLTDDYILAWSYGTGETFTFIYPSLKGGGNNDVELKNLQTLFPSRAEQLTEEMKTDLSSLTFDDWLLQASQGQIDLAQIPASQERGYYGQQGLTNGPVFIGVLLCLMALLSLVLSDGKLNWALFGVSILTILCAYLQLPVVVIFLFVILLVLSALNRRLIWFLTSTTLITVMLAWGKNFIGFSELFINYFPMYSKFRAVTMILAVSNMLIPLMGIMFLSKLISQRDEVKRNSLKLYIGIGVVALGTLVVWINPDSVFNFPDGLSSTGESYRNYFEQSVLGSSPEVKTQFSSQADQYFMDYAENLKEFRIGIVKDDALKALGFMAGLVILIFFFFKERISKYVLVGGLGVLLLIDLVPVDLKYLNNKKDEGGEFFYWKPKVESQAFAVFDGDLEIYNLESNQKPWLEDSVKVALSKANAEMPLSLNDQNILKLQVLNKNTNFRVANANLQSLSGESRTSYFYKSLGGYHGAKLRRIQDIFDFTFFNPGVAQFLDQKGVSFVELDQEQILNMMNVKYLVKYNYNESNDVSGVKPIPNPNALGAAWIVDRVQFVETADEEISAMRKGSGFNPSSVAIVDKTFSGLVTASETKDPSARVTIKKYSPNHLVYDFTSSKEETVIFSEVYYPNGWKAFIDDQPVEFFRANYILRGLTVPAGNHTITFKYDVAAYSTGSYIALISSSIVVLLICSLLYLFYSNHPVVRKEEDKQLEL